MSSKQPMTEKCFACDRHLTLDHKHAVTSDGQRVFVGANCFKLIAKSGRDGYQPPKGGPRLYTHDHCICDGCTA